MLTKLLPDQISKFWPIVKYAIEESLPPIVGEHPDKMNRILSSTLSGVLEVWVLYKRKEDVKVDAVVVTKMGFDEASGTKHMLIYCLYGYNEVTNSDWGGGLEVLEKYAKSKNCNRIIAYSSIPHLIKLAKKLGASAEYTFISFDLK